MDGLDAHLRQLLNGAGVDSWQVADMVVRAWRIAVVEKFAPRRVGAVASRWKSGAFGMLRTQNSARNWKVSLGCNLWTRRVRFLILKNLRGSIAPPSNT